jgi:hypothetical protein
MDFGIATVENEASAQLWDLNVAVVHRAHGEAILGRLRRIILRIPTKSLSVPLMIIANQSRHYLEM